MDQAVVGSPELAMAGCLTGIGGCFDIFCLFTSTKTVPSSFSHAVFIANWNRSDDLGLRMWRKWATKLHSRDESDRAKLRDKHDTAAYPASDDVNKQYGMRVISCSQSEFRAKPACSGHGKKDEDRSGFITT